MKHHPDNQVLIEYPQRLDRLAMGENRSEVLREISAVSNRKSMEATEHEDVVAISACLFHEDQGEAIGNAFGALDEIANLCHGARVKNHDAVEARRRVIEAGAKACATPVGADSLAHPAVDQEAMDATGGEESSGEEDNDQNPTTTRKTCDKGDSQDMNHASTSGQGKE